MEQREIERCLEDLHPASFGWALACCGRNREDAEDVLQAVYVKVLEGTARFGGHSTFKTWLFAVIRRTALERLRWRRVRERMMSALHAVPAASPADHSTAATDLLRALAAISNRQREVLELVFYHGMTIEEAAGTLGISLGAARVHYARGKKRLLEQLGKDGRLAYA